MKTLYLVGGTMGVGKTTVCKCMNRKLPESVFLDGDWCWDADPFQVTDETKKMVMENICFLLNQFLHCSAYQNVIFCWVMHEQGIIDQILNSIDRSACEVRVISLICREDSLRKRLTEDVQKGIRSPEIIEKSVARIDLYSKMKTEKIRTDDKTPEIIAEEIMSKSEK